MKAQLYKAMKMNISIVFENDGKVIATQNFNFCQIRDYVNSLDDSQSNNDIFKILAKHPSQEVRQQVASKDSLNMDVAQIFESEKSLNVIRSFVRSDSCKKYSSNELLVKWIALDVEVACSVASRLESYENADIDEILKILIKHSDPSVLNEIAENSSIPKKYLKELSKHKDTKISSAAKYSLS